MGRMSTSPRHPRDGLRVPVSAKVRRALRQRKRVRVALETRTRTAGKTRVARRAVSLR